ncbi:MAG: hypothetical protein ABR985_11765 [Methanotrichaceae archaeon]|jgi:hypothetical protein
MTWIGDIIHLAGLWKWARGSWWKTCLAIAATLLSFLIALVLIVLFGLVIFYKPEERWSVLSSWLLMIMGWIHVGTSWFSSNLLAILIVVCTFIAAVIMLTCIVRWYENQLNGVRTDANRRIAGGDC